MNCSSYFMILVGAVGIGTLFCGEKAAAFPENVRYGYASCSTCHVSPTGGGVLTKYGRSASEEFMGLAAKEGQNAFLHGWVDPPDWLIAGGDVRTLALYRDTKAFKQKAYFPMQAEIEVGATYKQIVTLVASGGAYNGLTESQRHYVLANFGEHVFARVGRFFPAYGIYFDNHAIVTRRGLGFNQGRESNNVEVGVVGTLGQITVDGILSSGQEELSDEEKGFSMTATWFAGQSSQFGLSLLQGKGAVWDRTLVGVHGIVGFTEELYLLTELDQEVKKPAEPDDLSTVDNTRYLGFTKLGWEVRRGIHILGVYEFSVTTEGLYDPRYWAGGPGMQLLPLPHFEFQLQVLAKHDETWSDEVGYQVTLMSHYYL